MTALPVFPHDAAASSVLIFGDVLFVGTGNGVDNKKHPLPSAPSLIALDKRTGRLLATENEQIGARVFHGQWSSPTLGWVGSRPLVFFGGGDGVCYAFDAVTATADSHPGFLHKVWSYDCTAPYRADNRGKAIDYWSGDRREGRGNLDDGRFMSPCEIIGTPVFYKNRIYVAIGQDPQHGRGRGLLTCIDATKTGDITSGGKIWSYDKIDRSLSSVSIADGLVYAADMPGRVHCLDAETGHCYWVHDCESDIWTSTLVVDGKVFVGTRKGLSVLGGRQVSKSSCHGPARIGNPGDAGSRRRDALRRFATISLGRRRLAAESFFGTGQDNRACRSFGRAPHCIAATAIRKTLDVIGRQLQLSETDFNLQDPWRPSCRSNHQAKTRILPDSWTWFPEFLFLRQRRVRNQVRLLGLAVLVGIVAGLGAILFYAATRGVEHYALGELAGYHPPVRPAGEVGCPRACFLESTLPSLALAHHSYDRRHPERLVGLYLRPRGRGPRDGCRHRRLPQSPGADPPAGALGEDRRQRADDRQRRLRRS